MINLPAFGLYDLAVFVLVFALVYGLLARSKFFSSSDIPALIAVAIGLITLMSSFFVSFLVAFLPYVLAIMFFIFLVIFLLSTALVPQSSILDYLKKSSLVPALVIFVMFIFGLIAFGTVSSSYPGILGATTSTATNATNSSTVVVSTSSFPGDLTSTYILSILTSPSFLTTLLTLMAMTIAVFALTRQTPGKK
ncbi:hypothetical protein M1558_03895 [Candidatus Parvarchaeota archaeon]|nr:hypothetical protein [Candidatus Parvarchaeota archaeon]